MCLATNSIHPTPRGGSCRIRIYLPDADGEALGDAPVVICSELPTNKGISVTNAEQISAEVIKQLPIVRSGRLSGGTTRERGGAGHRRGAACACEEVADGLGHARRHCQRVSAWGKSACWGMALLAPGEVYPGEDDEPAEDFPGP
jgi:hypothetical protein